MPARTARVCLRASNRRKRGAYAGRRSRRMLCWESEASRASAISLIWKNWGIEGGCSGLISDTDEVSGICESVGEWGFDEL